MATLHYGKSGTHNDFFLATGKADWFYGYAGSDTVSYANAPAGVTASLSSSWLNAGWAAGDRYDSIENLTGTQFRDILTGDARDNVLDGGGSADFLYGGLGSDTLIGGGGSDWLYGEGGNDLILAGTENDHAFGGAGNDTVYGHEGDDHLEGNEGDDLLFGNQGNDTLVGGPGNDTLYGGQGDDFLKGGAGDDVLVGGIGTDMMEGGAGADRFVFTPHHEGLSLGFNVIGDFNSAEGDRVDLGGQTVTVAESVGGHLTVELSGGGTITFMGYAAADFDASWFS
jgi:Ca2+-binding RTX toxin-like protein